MFKYNKLVSAMAILAISTTGNIFAQEFNLPTQDLETALKTFAQQSENDVFFSPIDTQGLKNYSISGDYSIELAIQLLLKGTGLTYTRSNNGAIAIRPKEDNAKTKKTNPEVKNNDASSPDTNNKKKR